MKIAHLSDLHICRKSRPENLKYTEILLQYAIGQGVDHIVITGDLIHLAHEEDFIALRGLFEKFDLLDPDKLSIVIGNHDIYGGVHLAEDVVKFPQKCQSVDYDRKVENYRKYFFEAFENCYSYSPVAGYPFIKTIENVAFIGINSTTEYSIFKNPFASKGVVEKSQLTGLKHILYRLRHQQALKFVMMHHHIKRQNLNDSLFRNSALKNIEDMANNLWRKNRLLKLFRRYGIDLILHGHEHYSGKYTHRKLVFLNAGGSIDKNAIGELKINLIEVTDKSFRTEVRTIRIEENTRYNRNQKEYFEENVLTPLTS